jgi:hypothetical protein
VMRCAVGLLELRILYITSRKQVATKLDSVCSPDRSCSSACMQPSCFHRQTKYLSIISGACSDISILVAGKYNIFKQLQSSTRAYGVRISIIVVVGRHPTPHLSNTVRLSSRRSADKLHAISRDQRADPGPESAGPRRPHDRFPAVR